MLSADERHARGIGMPPATGVEQRLEAILAELIGIRQALTRSLPTPAPTPPDQVTLREPADPARTRKRGA